MTALAQPSAAEATVSMELLDSFKDFSKLLERALATGERILITREGKPIGGIVPWEDVEILRALEDKIDGEAAKKALQEPGFLTLEEVQRELGI